jgi:hypothetical protein
MSLTAGVRGEVHPITYHEFAEGDFQVKLLRCVEYKLNYNMKYKIYIIHSDTTLYFVKLDYNLIKYKVVSDSIIYIYIYIFYIIF